MMKRPFSLLRDSRTPSFLPPRWGGLAAGALTIAASAIFATPASAADVCIGPQAKAALSECPGGALKSSGSKKPEVSFKTAPQGVGLKKRDTNKPTNPTASQNAAQRDERAAKASKKSRQLLVTEIQGLEALFSSTKKNAPDRPKLARRLAEGYVELEAAAFRDKTAAEVARDAAKKSNPKAAQQQAALVGTADKVLVAARKNAIKYYTLLKDQYPKWCQFPNADAAKSQGCTDEVLYYLAYEYEQAKDYENARKVYFELIDKWKQSKYIPNAYLAFGELFFQEAQGDPSKWALAEQSYQEVTKYPPPDNKVFGYAHYKLGYVYWNQGDAAKAINEFKQTIDYGTKFSQLPNAKPLAESARKDIVPVYALAGDPKKAYTFFRPLSGDAGSDNERTFKMMYDLGLNYLDTGHYPEGIALFQDLMSRDKGAKFCLYQSHITEATLAMKSSDKDFIMKELRNSLTAYNTYNQSGNQPADKLKCANVTAGLLTETAMAWHLEAVGSGGVRGTNDAKTMKLSAELYDVVVKNFTQDQFAKFEFPRILKEDWPNIFKIKYAMADLLYYQKDWEKCGPAFDSVVAENPKGPEAPTAAFAAVLCYQNIYAEKHKDGSDKKGGGNLPSDAKGGAGSTAADKAKFKPKDFNESQKGMITAFNRYVCYIQPAAGDKDAATQYAEVKYARARTYFESQHWEEAAEAFRDVALNHSDKEVGIYAAQLYLESLNVLGTHSEPARPSCYDNMATDVPQFVKLYCEGGKAKENEEQCGILFKIQRDIERLRAEKLVEAADKGGPEAIGQYTKAAAAYMELWEKYGKEPCEAGKKDQCARNEEILYNAARAYQAARLLAKAIAVRKILIDPKYNLHETELAKKATFEIGGNYQAIAVYDEAARWYERFAEQNPKMEQAPTALQDATVLRLGLGQEDQAIKNADLFNRNYGQKKPAESAQINFAIGAHYADKEDWPNARKRLSGAIGQIDRNATLDIQIQAHALLGLVNAKTGGTTAARQEYDKVRRTWANPADVVAKLNAIPGDEAQKQRRLGKALTAVGEALFFFAEEKRAAAEKIQFPEYKGSGDRDDVMKFVKGKVADWVQKKRPAIKEAEAEYIKIVELQPVPPPKWVIAAGARVGQMYGKFVAEFRAAPVPKEWKGPGMVPGTDVSYAEILTTYYNSLDEASEPIKQQAKGAYKTCLGLSVKHQYFDEYSRACEQWLSKNYPAEYRLIDEFRSSPNRVGSGLADRPLVLNIDGTVVPIERPQTAETPKAEAPKPEAKK